MKVIYLIFSVNTFYLVFKLKVYKILKSGQIIFWNSLAISIKINTKSTRKLEVNYEKTSFL